MASIKAHNGGWRVQVNKRGVRASKVFATKAEARAWGAQQEAEILDESKRVWPTKTVKDLCDRYALEVSSGKKGARAEKLRLAALCKNFPALAGKLVSDVQTPDLVAWRQQRLKEVSPGAVRRDVNILRNAFQIARREWHWLGHYPFEGFTVPSDNPPRERLPTLKEIRDIVRWLGYRAGPLPGKQQQVALAFLVACRTGMRAGEILSLTPARLDLDASVARVPHKTQHLTGRPRTVPLSGKAVRLLRRVAHLDPCFDVSSASMSALFHKAALSCRVTGLTFHDSRAYALTAMSKKVDPLTLAKVSGHRDMKVLLNTYFRPSESEIASRL
jgi:integrase